MPAAPDNPVGAGKLAVDWPSFLAAGYPDPRSPHEQAHEELQRIAGPLLRQAFATTPDRATALFS